MNCAHAPFIVTLLLPCRHDYFNPRDGSLLSFMYKGDIHSAFGLGPSYGFVPFAIMSSTIIPIPTPDPTSAAWNEYIDNQSFNLTGLDGTEVTIPLSALNYMIYVNLAGIAMNGVVIGATGVTMIVLLIFGNRKKARMPLYIINFLSLILQLVRNIITVSGMCQLDVYGFGEIVFGARAQFSKAHWAGPPTFIAATNPIFYALILSSLILQARAVFPTQIKLRNMVTIFLSMAALVVLGCWTAWQVFYMKIVWDAPYVGFEAPERWLYFTSQGGVTAFVGVTCAILVAKLFGAICWRHKMRIRQFGPFHILLITFGQCLVIPCTNNTVDNMLTIVTIFLLDMTLTFQNLDVLGQTFLICSFPLSAIWAAQDVGGKTSEPSLSYSPSITATERIAVRKFGAISRSTNASRETDMECSEISEEKT